jgi:hypothetical protein
MPSQSSQPAPARPRNAHRIGGVDAVRDLGDVLVPEVARRLRDLALDQAEERQLGSAGSTIGEARSWRRLRGRPGCCGAPSSPTTCSTRWTVSAFTPGRRFSTRSTVAVPTPGLAGDVGDGGGRKACVSQALMYPIVLTTSVIKSIRVLEHELHRHPERRADLLLPLPLGEGWGEGCSVRGVSPP